MQTATNERHVTIQWATALLMGAVSLMAFIFLGHTPFMRALGMAAAISGVTLILQRFGIVLAVVGSFALAFSPAFWSQSGGEDTKLVVLVALTLLVALVVTGSFILVGRVTERGLVAGVVVFAVLFWVLVGTPRSLRVTTLLNISLLYILIDIIMSTNPRPESPPMPLPGNQHTLGLLVLLLIGVLNDPLFVLLAPGLLIGLYVSKVRLPRWYWAVILLCIAIGIRGLVYQYVSPDWWLKSATSLQASGTQVPYFIADGWREASRWLYLINLVRNQFTDVGILLGILGLARLARWYPPLGTTTLAVYGSYALFGLIYFGKDSTVLLLPMMVIHVIWMTYAIYTLGQWLQKSFIRRSQTAWLATAVFTLLPLALLARIVGLL